MLDATSGWQEDSFIYVCRYQNTLDVASYIPSDKFFQTHTRIIR
jgi:hypothetical protein